MTTINPYSNPGTNQLQFTAGTKPVFFNPVNDFQNQIVHIPENNLPPGYQPTHCQDTGLIQSLLSIIRDLLSSLRNLAGGGTMYPVQKPLIMSSNQAPQKPSIGDRVVNWLSNNETINKWGNNLVNKFESWMPDWLTGKKDTSNNLSTTNVQSNEVNQIAPGFESAIEF